MAAMNLFAGVMLATMGVGHVLAVTTKLFLGTLEGSPLVLYPIGVAVLVPSCLVIAHTRAILGNEDAGRTTTGLNAWLAVTLMALGLHNLPLAAPSLLNIGYRLHSRRAIGMAIVSVAVVFNVALFVGAVDLHGQRPELRTVQRHRIGRPYAPMRTRCPQHLWR